MSRKTANNPTTIWYPYCSRVIRVAVYTWLFGAYQWCGWKAGVGLFTV